MQLLLLYSVIAMSCSYVSPALCEARNFRRGCCKISPLCIPGFICHYLHETSLSIHKLSGGLTRTCRTPCSCMVSQCWLKSFSDNKSLGIHLV